MFPDASDEIFSPAADEHRIRVVFNGAFATNTPLITKMAMDEGIAANILAASTAASVTRYTAICSSASPGRATSLNARRNICKVCRIFLLRRSEDV